MKFFEDLQVTQKYRILAVEDDPHHAELLQLYLGKIDEYEIDFERVGTLVSAEEKLQDQSIDIIFLDYHLGINSGLELLRKMRLNGDHRPVIVLTGRGDEYVAVDMMKAGADDYICKDDMGPAFISKSMRTAISNIEKHRDKYDEQADIRQKLEELTAREKEVLDMVVSGKTTKEIAKDLFRSESTIKIHRTNVMKKMNASTPADLTRMVMMLKKA